MDVNFKAFPIFLKRGVNHFQITDVKTSMNNSWWKALGWGAVAGAAIVAVDAYIIERYLIKIRNEEIPGRKPKLGLKVLQVSDLHFSTYHHGFTLLARRIRTAKPDLIVFTGDVVNGNFALKYFERFLSLLPESTPKLAIPGNWEYKGKVDMDALNAIYLKYNTELLVNRCKSITVKDKKLLVAGLDDCREAVSDYDLIFSHYQKADLHLVLAHCPEALDEIEKRLQSSDVDIDLIISGHTHGRQIDLPMEASRLPSGSAGYKEGWYKGEKTRMFVSKGAGEHGVPFRFGAHAEVVMFHV